MIFLSRPNELLQTHIDEVFNQYKIITKYENNTNSILNNLVTEINKDIDIDEDIIIDILDNVIYYHDYGKMNPYFQKYIGNQNFKEYTYNNDHMKDHSFISAIKYINNMYEKHIKYFTYTNKRKQIRIKQYLCNIIFAGAYNILKHHGNLDNKEDNKLWMENIITDYEKFKDRFEFVDINIENLKNIQLINSDIINWSNPFEFYLLMKINYSLLIKCDYLAVYKFKNNKDLKSNRIDSQLKDKFMNSFDNDPIIKDMYENKKLSPINTYRKQMFTESYNNLINNKDKSIFFLECPTGGGKSTIAINLGLNLLNDTYTRIIYVSPLNNISEQMNESTCNKLNVQKEGQVVLINNRETIVQTDEYEKDYLNYQTFNYPIVLTSHVKLFNILFGCNRKDLLALESLTNSVIILDEIQNYNNKIWIKLINSIVKISKVYNIKFIIMSATLPKMDKLIENKKCDTVDLITNTEHYYNYFKARVRYDYSLIDKLGKNDKNTKEEVLQTIDEVIENTDKHRILIETLTTGTCEEFYTYLKKYEEKGFLVFKILSITNLSTRREIIKDIQSKNKDGVYKNNKIILIGTQCIEAGIDIDMNIGFKDISILDYDEQFIGRIERNFKNTGKCYFFDLDNDEFIYKDDYRIEFNLKTSLEYRKLFEDKKFSEYYNHNYEWLLKKETKDYKEFINKVNILQYRDVSDSMKLIDNKTYTFLFMGEYYDGTNIYNSEDILRQYEHIKKDFNIDYAEKQIKLKELKKKLDNFTYNINSYNFKEEILFEEREGFYIVEKGEEYFDNIHDGKITNKSNLDLGLFKGSVNLFL